MKDEIGQFWDRKEIINYDEVKRKGKSGAHEILCGSSINDVLYHISRFLRNSWKIFIAASVQQTSLLNKLFDKTTNTEYGAKTKRENIKTIVGLEFSYQSYLCKTH